MTLITQQSFHVDFIRMHLSPRSKAIGLPGGYASHPKKNTRCLTHRVPPPFTHGLGIRDVVSCCCNCCCRSCNCCICCWSCICCILKLKFSLNHWVVRFANDKGAMSPYQIKTTGGRLRGKVSSLHRHLVDQHQRKKQGIKKRSFRTRPLIRPLLFQQW